MESRLKAEDEKARADKLSLLDLLKVKSEEFQRDIAQIGMSISNLQA